MLNKVMIIGRVGQAPTVRQAAGKSVASFSVATTEVWVQDGKKNERTDWHRIVAWGQLGDVCGKYLSKGKLVYVEGRIATRKWTDNDGVEKYTTEIVAETMKMLPGGKEDRGSADAITDDIPF